MSEFVDFLREVFQEWGEIKSRKMFGGYGIYHDGVMFGLVADDELYLKVDDTNVSEFESRGLGAFEYNKAGKVMKMSYYRAPEEIFDDPDEAAVWAKRSFEVAFSAKVRKSKR